MAERTLGEALRAVVTQEAEAPPVHSAGESVLMSPPRQRVFEYLCSRPCSTPAQIARALGLSAPTVQWHLVKLRRAEYLLELGAGRSRLFFPAGLPLDARDLSVLSTLHGLGGWPILAATLARPGLTLRQLADATGLGLGAARVQTRRLSGSGLLVVVVDGRYRRFYPGPEVSRLDRESRRKLRAFRTTLLRRLERDRLGPTTRLSRGREAELELHVGDRTHRLRLPADSLFAPVGETDG